MEAAVAPMDSQGWERGPDEEFDGYMERVMAKVNEAMAKNRHKTSQQHRVSDDPADLGELFDAEQPDYEEPDAMFRYSCVANLKQVLLKQKRMSKAAAQEFVSKRVTIDVQNACYEDEDEIRTLAVISRIQAADDPSKAVELHYDYHHRCRWSWVEHFATLKYTMHSMDGLDKVFETTNEDLPVENACQVEQRQFWLTEHAAKAIRDEVFGDGWSMLQALLVCYAAAGVCFGYRNVHLPSAAEYPSLKGGWLEHYTCTACKLVKEADDGYESEPFAERYEAEMSSARAHARDLRGDDENDWDSEDDEEDDW